MDFLTSLDFWLWVASAVAALFYIMAFFMKVVQPKEKTAAMIPWVGESSPGFVKFVGFVDLAGGLGLILPVATDILPFLTPLAALGTIVLQVLAIGLHARRGGNLKDHRAEHHPARHRRLRPLGPPLSARPLTLSARGRNLSPRRCSCSVLVLPSCNCYG